MALILLAELSYEIGEEFRPHLHSILHLVFLGFDNPHFPVHEHSRILLLNLINSLIVKRMKTDGSLYDPERYHESLDLLDYLKSKENKQLWASEDIVVENTTVSSTQELSNLVSRVIYVLSGNQDLNEKWAAEGKKKKEKKNERKLVEIDLLGSTFLGHWMPFFAFGEEIVPDSSSPAGPD
jgi:hypothetical protein